MKNFKSIVEHDHHDDDIRPAKEGEGADDKQYFLLMSEYKKTRRSDIEAAKDLLLQAQELLEKGDVSHKAKLAVAYL